MVYGGMVALLAAPVVEQRFDATGDALGPRPTSTSSSAAFFADRDPAVGFAADAVMQLADLEGAV